MKIDHIGIAVKNLEEGIASYEKFLGKKVDSIETVTDQKVMVAIFKLENVRIELLCPTEVGSNIDNFIQKRGEGVHHICMGVNDIAAEETRLKGLNVPLIYEKHQMGAEECLVNFIHPKALKGVLTEISQRT